MWCLIVENMENLRLKAHETVNEEILDTGALTNIHLDDNVCCYLSSLHKLHIRYVSGEATVVDIPKDLQGNIVLVCFLSIWKVVFIATTSKLITFDVVNSTFSHCEANANNARLVQASWNPTQTFLVVIDEAGSLWGYSFSVKVTHDSHEHEFIHFTEGHLEEDVPNSVYVGWGAHNTQFKGSKKQEEVIEEIPQDYSIPIVSWRGNGEMFVINYWKENRRFLKVFNSNLKPLFGSEPYNNLLGPTSFKGQGNFIACAATDGKTNRIVIFEKNCLVKSKFLAPENKGEIKAVQYHREKHILAVHSKSSNESCLNIYLYANDTWYLKRQFCYPSDSFEKLLKFHWVSEINNNTCRLNVLTSKGIHLYTFTLEICGVAHDLLAVINGPEVLFSDFSKEIIPPPMGSITLQCERPVNEIHYDSLEDIYRFQLSNDQVIYYKFFSGGFALIDASKNGQFCENNTSSFQKVIDDIPHFIQLNLNQELLIDEQIVFSNVLSVHLHRDYLLFTHVASDSYKLCSVRLTQENINCLDPEIFFSREVEQGAKIICVTDMDQVILSLPRGNLETITCRLIAIDAIERFLADNQWSKAVNQIRYQKLNWNLLIDLNKRRFADHIKDFIKAANSVSLLNTIVSEFGTENCLQTMYKAWYKQTSAAGQYLLEKDSETPKIDILSAILRILVALNPIVNLLSIVTLQIKHYSIKAALHSVLQVFLLEKLDVCKKAVAQILRYKHAKDVICAAYTLYNIDFLSFIYSACSEDPRVFAPEIEELQTLQQIDLRYIMNVRGKEFEKATKYLIRSQTKDDAFISDFIKKYGTQRVAYNSLAPGNKRFKLITRLYADYLGLKTKHNEAGLILERAGLKEEALNRYKIARNWLKVVALLNVLEVESDAKMQALRALGQDLINHKQVEDGALVYQHYCGDYKTAVEALVEHNLFQKALCIARQYKSQELVDHHIIRPSLKKYREDLYDRISELGNKFDEYTTRLLQLRQKKCEKLLRRFRTEEGLELENDLNEFETDSVNSEYGSIISRSSMGSFSSGGSRSSTLSSRNRRKLERRKTDLREGGTYEDIALIRQLYLLAIDIYAAGQEVVEVCACLCDEENFQYGKKLQGRLEDVQNQVQANIPRIWTDIFLNAEVSTAAPLVAVVIENRHELDEEFRTPPPSNTLNSSWKSSIFS